MMQSKWAGEMKIGATRPTLGAHVFISVYNEKNERLLRSSFGPGLPLLYTTNSFTPIVCSSLFAIVWLLLTVQPSPIAQNVI